MRTGAAALFALAAVASGAPARGESPERAACANAYEQAQVHRRDHALTKAHAELLVCSRSACASWMQKECVRWLGEVDVAMPSIVVSVKGPDGAERTDAKVTIDGTAFGERAGAAPIPLDPGEHTIAVEAEGWAARQEQRVTLKEGEHARRVEVTLAASRAGTAPESRPTPREPEEEDELEPRARRAPAERPVPTLVYVLGAAGLVAAGVGAYFQLDGMTARSDLYACSPRCPEAQVDDAREALWIGNIGLGAAAIALAAAAVLYLTRPEVRPSPSSAR